MPRQISEEDAATPAERIGCVLQTALDAVICCRNEFELARSDSTSPKAAELLAGWIAVSDSTLQNVGRLLQVHLCDVDETAAEAPTPAPETAATLTAQSATNRSPDARKQRLSGRLSRHFAADSNVSDSPQTASVQDVALSLDCAAPMIIGTVMAGHTHSPADTRGGMLLTNTEGGARNVKEREKPRRARPVSLRSLSRKHRQMDQLAAGDAAAQDGGSGGSGAGASEQPGDGEQVPLIKVKFTGFTQTLQ